MTFAVLSPKIRPHKLMGVFFIFFVYIAIDYVMTSIPANVHHECVQLCGLSQDL